MIIGDILFIILFLFIEWVVIGLFILFVIGQINDAKLQYIRNCDKNEDLLSQIEEIQSNDY